MLCANGRCDQENLLAQLKSGVRALRAPVNTLESNWAFMVMTALAWDLKAWWALLLPEESGRWKQQHSEQKRWVLRLEFRTFVSAPVVRSLPAGRTTAAGAHPLSDSANRTTPGVSAVELESTPADLLSSGRSTPVLTWQARSRRPDAPIRCGSTSDPAERTGPDAPTSI